MMLIPESLLVGGHLLSESLLFFTLEKGSAMKMMKYDWLIIQYIRLESFPKSKDIFR